MSIIPELLWYPAAALAYLMIACIARLIRTWVSLRSVAYRLSDDVVAALNQSENPGQWHQITEGFTRRPPPRHLYVTAVAVRGEPVRMYRGWKLWSTAPLLEASESTTAGLSCYRIRLFLALWHHDAIVTSCHGEMLVIRPGKGFPIPSPAR